jgi:hypothetical protein
MRRTERRIAFHLGRDQRPQLADRSDVGADGRLGQLPVEMQPLLAFFGNAARDDLEGRRTEMLGKVVKLVVNEAEAKKVRMIFERFVKLGSATVLVRALRAEGIAGKQGKLVDKGYVYKLLNNRVYVGQAVHKGTAYPGEHSPIVSQGLWDRVHDILAESPHRRGARTRAQTPALLKGLIFGPTGRAMTPTHTRRGGKLYRYDVSTDVLKSDADACPVRRIPAAEIESAVIEQVRVLLRSPEVIVRTWRVARRSLDGLSEVDVREALERLDPLWDELFPAEQARIVQLLVERVDIGTEGADIRLRTQGLTSLVEDLGTIRPEARRAA